MSVKFFISSSEGKQAVYRSQNGASSTQDGDMRASQKQDNNNNDSDNNNNDEVECSITNCKEIAYWECNYNVVEKSCTFSAYDTAGAEIENGLMARIYICDQHAQTYKPPVGWELSWESNSVPQEQLDFTNEAHSVFTTHSKCSPSNSKNGIDPKGKETPLLDRAFRRK